MRITAKHIRLLGQLERDMDSGKMPFVRVEGREGRYAMTPEMFEQFAFSPGQVISAGLMHLIMTFSYERVKEQLAFERGQALMKEEVPS